MSNAFGGIVNISFIVVFLVIVSGYLAFSVNYNKAFRVKNKIINSIEVCEGIEGTPTAGSNECAQKRINEYMSNIGYSLSSNFRISNYDQCGQGYCYKKIIDTEEGTDAGIKYHYNVATAVNIDIPILNKILPNMKIFQVSGSTKTITKY